ncbi:hypothetical protein EMCRGX_G027962 [Ephydatia muelleri]
MKTVPKKVKELLTSGWTSDNGDEDLKLYRKRRSSACRMGAYCGESLSQSAEQLSRKYMLDTKESPGKALAQSFVWWPHLDADLVKKARDYLFISSSIKWACGESGPNSEASTQEVRAEELLMGRKLHSHLSFLLPGVEERVEHPRGGKRSVMTEGLRSVGKRVLVKNFAVGGSKSLLGVITRRRGPVAVEEKETFLSRFEAAKQLLAPGCKRNATISVLNALLDRVIDTTRECPGLK